MLLPRRRGPLPAAACPSSPADATVANAATKTMPMLVPNFIPAIYFYGPTIMRQCLSFLGSPSKSDRLLLWSSKILGTRFGQRELFSLRRRPCFTTYPELRQLWLKILSSAESNESSKNKLAVCLPPLISHFPPARRNHDGPLPQQQRQRCLVHHQHHVFIGRRDFGNVRRRRQPWRWRRRQRQRGERTERRSCCNSRRSWRSRKSVE